MAAPLDLDAFLPYRLNRLASAASRAFAATYRRRHALTVPEWRVLATLGQYGPLTATAIGTHSAMHKTKVSRAVRALEARRWVARAVDPADRRSFAVRLSPAGEAAYRTLAAMALSFSDTLLANLSAEERRTVDAAMTLLEDRLGIRRGHPD